MSSVSLAAAPGQLPTDSALATIRDMLPRIARFVELDVADIAPEIDQELIVLPPVPLVAFVGPSGAGKSTLFTLVTGVDTATGKDVWPCSFVPCAAIPRDLAQGDVAALLPGLEPVERQAVDDVRDESAPRDRVLIAESQLDDLIVCDLPDIDGTVLDNHERARKIVRLADRLIFTCSRHNYASRTVIDSYAEFLGMLPDGEVVFLLTQLTPGDPAEVRASASGVIDNFRRRLLPERAAFRADARDAFGRSLLERALSATYAYSPRSQSPLMADIKLHSSSDASESFLDLLRPRRLHESRRERKLQRLDRIRIRIDEVLRRFDEMSLRVDKDRNTLRDLEEKAFPKTLVDRRLENFLPLSPILGIAIETAQKLNSTDSLAKVSRWVGTPLRIFRDAIGSLLSLVVRSPHHVHAFHEAVSQLRKAAVESLGHEKELVSPSSDALCTRYDLAPGRFAQLQEEYLAKPNPDPQESLTDETWRREVAREAEEWCKDPLNNQWVGVLLYVAPVITPLLTGLAVAVVVVDLLHGGLGTGILLALKALGLAGFFVGGQKAFEQVIGGLKTRIARLREEWLGLYRHQLLSQLQQSVTSPHFGETLSQIAKQRDTLRSSVIGLGQAAQWIDEQRRVMKSEMAHKGVGE